MSNCNRTLIALLATPLLGALAVAEPPASYALEYQIHEKPGDANTDLLWTVTLALIPASQDGDIVEWKIVHVTISDLVGERLWADAIPESAQPSWVVHHDDPDAPAESEFCAVPQLDRLAAAESGTPTDLEYEFVTACSAAFQVPMASWTLSLQGGPQLAAGSGERIIGEAR